MHYYCYSPLFEKIFVGKLLKKYEKSCLVEIIRCSKEDEITALRLMYKMVVPLNKIYKEK